MEVLLIGVGLGLVLGGRLGFAWGTRTALERLARSETRKRMAAVKGDGK